MINNFMLKIFVYFHQYIIGKSKNRLGTQYNYVQVCVKKNLISQPKYMSLIKGKKQNQQSLAVRFTFYIKFDAFRSCKDFQDDENDISSY